MLTRWWTIGATIKQCFPNLNKWATIALKCADAYPEIVVPNQCASAIILLIAEPVIEAHLRWIGAFHKIWWNQHFVWLSAVDKTRQETSLRRHHMATHTLIMIWKLEHLAKTWRDCLNLSLYLQADKKVAMDYDQKCFKVL